MKDVTLPAFQVKQCNTISEEDIMFSKKDWIRLRKIIERSCYSELNVTPRKDGRYDVWSTWRASQVPLLPEDLKPMWHYTRQYICSTRASSKVMLLDKIDRSMVGWYKRHGVRLEVTEDGTPQLSLL